LGFASNNNYALTSTRICLKSRLDVWNGSAHALNSLARRVSLVLLLQPHTNHIHRRCEFTVPHVPSPPPRTLIVIFLLVFIAFFYHVVDGEHDHEEILLELCE